MFAKRPSDLGAILVGGRATRLGGVPKGLLRRGDKTLVTHLLKALHSVGVSNVCLAGEHRAYNEFARANDLTQLADRPSGRGPIGGLRATLKYAQQQAFRRVVLLSCDLAHVSHVELERLVRAPQREHQLAKTGEQLQPFPSVLLVDDARETTERVFASGRRSILAVFAALRLPVREHLLDNEHGLDWDTREDVFRAGCLSDNVDWLGDS